MSDQVKIVPGMTVYASDEEKLGKVVGTGENHIVVEKGFFFPTEYYIPLDAITGATDDRVYLSVTKDEAANQSWGDQPDGWTGDSAYQETAYGQADSLAATDADVVATDYTETTSAAGYSSTDTGTEVIAPDYVASDDRAATGNDAIRVPVYEEELQAVTRDVERGAVRIEKELVTEERTITVPVTEERVRVTRVDASDPNVIGDDAFNEGVIEVPVRGQEVDVAKSARKTGEVVVEREAVTRTEQVGGTVRREEVRVEDETVEGVRPDDDRR